MLKLDNFGALSLPFHYFDEICKIPHGSGNCGKIADYLVDFAKKHSLEYERDEWHNVLIRKPATAGYEERPTVILQGHTDMVAENTPDSEIDMNEDGLKIYTEGDYITADGTTLGGDDGIAVAYMLAILASGELEHPALEALFTSDEEIGLIGAGKVNPDWLKGRTLINIDSEEEGVFTVGCAGGVRVDMTLKDEDCDSLPSDTDIYTVKVCGLIGGHSGVEIDKGRANAAKLMASVLAELGDIRLLSIVGGNMDNAIMRECEAHFTTSLSEEKIRKAIDGLAAQIKKEYPAESELTFNVSKSSYDTIVFNESVSRDIVALLTELPFGVIKMSDDIKGLPETSANVGVVRIDATSECSRITSSLRSSKKDELSRMKEHLVSIASQNEFTTEFRGEYPAWEYKPDSHLRDTAVKLYREKYGIEPVVMTIHAGLECGALSEKLAGLDCISIGPDMCSIHTTEERLSISSSVRVYEFILELLKRL